MNQRFITALIALFALAGCSNLIVVQIPDMKVVGGKTLLEEQVVGRYREIDEQAFMLSVGAKTRAQDIQATGDRPVDAKLLARYQNALIRRAFNDDDIVRYKGEQYIGENNQWRLEYVRDIFKERYSIAGVEKSANELSYIQTLIKEENEDRKTVIEYIIASDSALINAEVESVENILYTLNLPKLEEDLTRIKRAQPVVWYQDRSGMWLEKTLP